MRSRNAMPCEVADNILSSNTPPPHTHPRPHIYFPCFLIYLPRTSLLLIISIGVL